MENTIKKINMETLCESIMELEGRTEEGAEKKCLEAEDNQEFKDLFFFHDDNNNYFYQANDELKIKEFIQNNIDKDIINDEYIFVKYIDHLKGCDDGCNISFNDYMGTLQVSNFQFYDLLGEFLEDEENIKNLVNTKDFNKEMKAITTDCLNTCIHGLIENLKDQVTSYELNK